MKTASVSRNDQVFQLSLTEIAFTVSFILLLLLGYLVVKEQTERQAAEAALAGVKGAEQLTAALEQSKRELQSALEHSGSATPSETITRLVDAEKVRQERDTLRQQLMDADAKLTALVELQRRIASAAPRDSDKLIQETVASAVAFEAAVMKALQPEEPGSSETSSPPAKVDRAKQLESVKGALEVAKAISSEAKVQFGAAPSAVEVRDIVKDAKAFRDTAKPGGLETTRKENSDLRGQVAFLKNRLDARGGRDYPPCWADESGKVEFLVIVELRADSVLVTRAWPERRSADAAKLPGLSELLEKSSSHQAFPSAAQPVFNWSRRQDPECRHYVQLRSTIGDAVQSDRARLMVENFFYKVEARR